MVVKRKLPVANGRYRIERGFYLVVREPVKSWIYRYSFKGKRKELSLGSALIINQTEAHKRFLKAQNMVVNGIDPMEQRKRNRSGFDANKLTFGQFYEEAIKQIGSVKLWKNKKHSNQWISSIKQHVVPRLGSVLLTDIDRDLVEAVLKKIWLTKPETASRIRGRLEAIFSVAKVKGLYTANNPAVWKDNLELVLPPISKVKKKGHFCSMQHEELKEKFCLLYPSKGVVYDLIVFTILAACRIGESAPAKWDEFDLKKAVWNVPPERRKDGKQYPHRVPLTKTMLKILKDLKGGGSDYVFPVSSYSHKMSVRNKKVKHISKESPRVIIQRVFKNRATMHGMRSTFRDWAAETGVPDILAEKSLMHSVGSETVQAYQRSDLLEQRRKVMQSWDDYLNSRISLS